MKSIRYMITALAVSLLLTSCPLFDLMLNSGATDSNTNPNITQQPTITPVPTPTPDTSGSSLLINEIGSSYYYNGSWWIEVYNNSSSYAHLADYQLKTKAISRANGSSQGIITFNLPSLFIAPGAYALIRGRGSDHLADGAQVVHLLTSTDTVPFCYANGFVELLKNSATVDFVKFGTDTTTPVTVSEWSGGAASAIPSTINDFGKSLARSSTSTDTNQAGDWVLRDFSTPGGMNDVTNNTDNDGDGIPDSAETNGGTFAGLDLYSMGARTGQKDIFIHIDYMDSTDPGVTPKIEALDKVVDAFNSQGYTVHFDVGTLYVSGIDPSNYNLDNKSHKVPFAQGTTLGSSVGKANLYAYKNQYMELRKRQVFYYVLFGYTQQADGSGGSSGLSECPGNDCLISLGDWGLNTGTTAETNRLINYQAGTLMHEFGHCLGLRHGGDVDDNYKPNYYSIMNYLYQLYGLPVIGNNEGDRYYKNTSSINHTTTTGDLINGPLTNTLKIDYSDGSGSSIDENSINEDNGLGRSGSVWVDYNDNNSHNSGLSLDINQSGGNSTITDYDDWSHINIVFQNTYSGSISGTVNRSAPYYFSPIADDYQPVYPDPCISRPQ